MARVGNKQIGLGSVRIVGGRWRGRKLPVLQRPGLRPTGDRQRETLFNWLQGDLLGAHCLDLFAGSGALGLEALSRGAASLQSVELDRAVAEQLRQNAQTLEAAAKIAQMDWQKFLAADNQQYDVVFLDPPFAQELLPSVLLQLPPRLADGARVYVEQGSDQADPEWPEGWQLKKHKKSGGTIVRLFHVVSRDTC